MTRHKRLVAAVLCVLGLTVATLAVPSSAGALSTSSRIEVAVFKLLNQERAAHHLRAVLSSKRLKQSAAAHNAAMARVNTLSHRLPGERDLGARITHTTFPWTWAGENIGYNTDMSTNGALVLERMMYGEKPPNDGHRLNILSRLATSVGIEVLLDTRHHKLWLTVDFGHYHPA